VKEVVDVESQAEQVDTTDATTGQSINSTPRQHSLFPGER